MESLESSDWIGLLTLIVTFIGVFFVRKVMQGTSNKFINAEKGSISIGDDARNNKITLNNQSKTNGDDSA